NGEKNPTAPPRVGFACQMSPQCTVGQPCCYGTPYSAAVTDTAVEIFRFNVNNGGAANLTRLGATSVDFETSGGCTWVFNDGELPVVPDGVTCSTDCITALISKMCTKTTNAWTYQANLTQMNVKRYAFGLLPLKNTTVLDNILVQDRLTHLSEITTVGSGTFTIKGLGNPPQPPPPSTQVDAAAMSASGNSVIEVTGADLSVAGIGNFAAIPIGALKGATIKVTNCTVSIPYFGAAGDSSCGRPTAIPNKSGDKPICEGSGVICYACNQADATARRCTLDHFVNICRAPGGPNDPWPEAGCPNP
ncbi:MAG: hypothetical protein HYR55_02395, partial [Acidobacteria bacterium]|nr:hypothetical protein [Acidobacteriota bacterium]